MYPEQYQQPNNRPKKIAIILGLVLAFIVIVVLLIAAGNKSSKSKIANDLTEYTGNSFTIKYPKDFRRTYEKELVTRFASKENVEPKESVEISGDLAEASPLKPDALDYFIRDAEKNGATVKQTKQKDHQRISFTSTDKDSGLVIQETYYIYTDYVWKVAITHGEKTTLSNYLDTILDSFVYTPPKEDNGQNQN